MLTFGGGVHYCLGAHLAQLELAQALTVITRRMPNPRRTGPAPGRPSPESPAQQNMPIEFDPGTRRPATSSVGCQCTHQ